MAIRATIAAVLAALLFGMPTGSALAADPPYPDASVAAVQTPTTVDVFWHGADAGVLESWYGLVTDWHSPGAVPGTLATVSDGPAGIFDAGGAVDLFWSGADRGVWELRYKSSWQTAAAEVPGTSGLLSSSPAAMSSASTIEVYWRGADNGLWEATDDGAWHAPTEVPGTAGLLTSAPSAAQGPASTTDVYFRGTDGGLWEVWYDTVWNGPAEVPGTAGQLTSAPSAAHGATAVDVYWRGADGGLWETWYDSHWNGPVEMPGTVGQLTSAPSAAHGAGEIGIYWRGVDGGLWENWYDTAWHGPSEMPGTPGQLANDTTATTLPGTSTIPVVPPSGRKTIKGGMKIQWHWSRTVTRLDWARLAHGDPAALSLTITCAGHGCPRRRVLAATGVGTLRRSLGRLSGTRFRPGDVVTIRMAAPGFTTSTVEVIIRADRIPRVRMVAAAASG